MPTEPDNRAQPPARPAWRGGVINAAVLFGILAALWLTCFVVDPFDLNRTFDVGLDKESVAYDFSNYNWKLAAFVNGPKPVVLLGDSRTRGMPADEFERLLGEEVFNFAYGGSSAFDSVDTFWFAAEHGELTRVYIGLGSLMLNDHYRLSRAQATIESMDQSLRYYVSPLVLQATWRVLGWNWFGVGGTSEKPPRDRDSFWRHQLDVMARQYYADFAHPTDLLAELQEVADHCRDNDIELVLFMPPTHTDLQERRSDFGLDEAFDRALRELRQVGPVVDFDYPNEVTRDRELFGDPFHIHIELRRRIATELAGGEWWFGRRLEQLEPEG